MNNTSLLEIRHKITVLYIRHEQYIKYALRFFLALACIGMINARIGYWEMLSGFIVTFSLSLICAVLPTGFTAFFAAVLILAHLYRLSLESCALALALFLCAYLMYYRFSPHDAIVILLTPLLFVLHIPSVMPFVVGLLFLPVSIISMSFGVVIYFFLHALSGADAATGAAGAEESIGRIQQIVGALIGDKTMMVYLVAFLCAAALIYVIRRLSADHAWLIAIGVGAFVNLLVLLVGNVALDAEVGILGMILGTLLGVAVSFVIMFFVFNVDYSRVERAQFEDEDYYYYVKAVPKIVLQEKAPRVRNINRSHDNAEEAPHAAHQKQQGARHKSGGNGRESGELTKARQKTIRSSHNGAAGKKS